MRMCLLNNYVGEIDDLPGCSQIAVSHSVFALKKGAGQGRQANEQRLNIMAELGYDYTLCTSNLTNGPQRTILESNGWTLLASFTSSKTGNLVGVWGRHVPLHSS